jgi:hypothetical protein
MAGFCPGPVQDKAGGYLFLEQKPQFEP